MTTALLKRAACLIILGAGVIVFPGCASLTTQTIGLDEYSLPHGDFVTTATQGSGEPAPHAPPSEMAMVTMPDYVAAPSDVLLIVGARLIPKEPYEIQTGDQIQIVVLGTEPTAPPIAGPFLVNGNGYVDLGPGYGQIKLSGLTKEGAADEIRAMLGRQLQSVQASVGVIAPAGQQQINGEHLVTPSGTVNLGVYGSVFVAGMTLEEVQNKIRDRLSIHFDDPIVTADVLVYNSQNYYIIIAGAGAGDQVARFPVTGSETVLDAIQQIGGIGTASSKKIWIARPTPGGTCDQIIPVDWNAITRGASATTNYQLFPGDRLFIAENQIISWAQLVNVFLNPFERVLGFSLLGAQTVQTLQRFPQGFNQGF